MMDDDVASSVNISTVDLHDDLSTQSHVRIDKGDDKNSDLVFDKDDDGFPRWIRGVSQPSFLVASVAEQILAYVSGCHIKYLQVSASQSPARADVIRIFQPPVEGIGLIEGNPAIETYAIAESTRKPRILIYRYNIDANSEVQVACLKGCAEFEYRALRFTKKDLLLVHVGVPEFTVSVWRWASEEELLVVSSLENEVTSDLIISNAFDHYWVEWSQSYITFYELQAFTENNVIRTEISLPPNQVPAFMPDPRGGAASEIDIVSVTWTNNGDLFVLDANRNVYKLKIAEKSLIKVGPIPYEPKSKITGLYPYENYLAAGTSTGTLLILVVDFATITLKGKVELSGNIARFLPFCQNGKVLTNSFYAINDTDRLLDVVIEGKLRSSVNVTDFVYSNVKCATFIEPEANHLATVSEDGTITIWSTRTGELFAKWRLSFHALTVQSHPLIPYVAVGASHGRVFFIDVRKLDEPRIMYRGYLTDSGVIDRIAFCARGKLLVSGDANRGKIFLQYGLPTLNFIYLDHAILPGKIWHINIPPHYRDLRLQILTKNPEDDVPSYLNNYKLDNDQLDLVASQVFDAPMTSLCFSPFKRLMYCYSCEGMGIGLIPYTEDLQAGSLKEPDLQFNFDFQLDLNRILVASNKFFTFGEDGLVMIHQPPAPKNPETVTVNKILTHFFGQGGIKDGIISGNGNKMLVFGHDGTLVHITIDNVSKPDWEMIGLGNDMKDVINAQMKIFNKIGLDLPVEIHPDELSLEQKDEEEKENFNARKYFKETQAIEKGLDGIRVTMKELLKENEQRADDDRLDMDEFELDSDEDEIVTEEFTQDKAIAEVVATSIIDERKEWVKRMKNRVWDAFQVTGSRVNGFEFSREVSNYPLLPVEPEHEKLFNETIQGRIFEKKVDGLEDEINRIGASASVNVLQIVLGMENQNNLAQTSSNTEEAQKFAQRKASDAIERAMDMSIEDDQDAEGNEEPDHAEVTENEPTVLEAKQSLAGANDAFASPPPIDPDALKDGDDGTKIDDEDRNPTPDGVPVEAAMPEETEDELQELLETSGGDMNDVSGDYANYTYKRKKRKKVVKTESGEDLEVSDDEGDDGGSVDSGEDDKDLDVFTLPNDFELTMAGEGEEDDAERRHFLLNLYYGSMVYEFVKTNPMMHDQLQLSSRHHIRSQMALIEMDIRRLKEYFNRMFEDMRQLKEAEMQVIADRNQRLREITDYFGINMDIADPAWSISEDPASVFIVRDDEVPFERFYTEEERAEMERRRLEEEARRLAAQDDFRERALIVMMDGVLERRKEDMLKKDIPKPSFMQTKEEWEWNQEEFKLAEEYNKKVAELEQMRAEFKKELEQELRTLIRANADSKQMIDDRVKDLWILKIRIEMCIKMEEIKLCRMVKMIMRRQQLDADENRLSGMLKKLQDSMKSSQNLASQLLTRVEASTKRYEFVMDRERLLERTFRRDLGEVGHFFDLFMRLYKKRPKLSIKNERSPEITALMIKALGAQNLRMFANENGEIGEKIAAALMELDDPIQNPMGCPRSTWDRFASLRRDKILCEYEGRSVGTELLELKQALSECKAREDEVAMAMATVLASLSHQRDIKMVNVHNFEFQLVLNQGQVELPNACTRMDFYNAVLLKKKFIEICNHFITKYGAVKLRAMNLGKVQHRQIKQLEWRYKGAMLTKENLLEKFHDINTIKATKEILHFIKQGRNFKKMQEARLQKIRELQIMAENFHKRFMSYQESLLKMATNQEKFTGVRNKRIDKLIFEQNLYVNEARLLCDTDSGNEKESLMRRRMKIIMQTGRMMRRIARNAEEIVLLENELDRQYRRTYPVL